jgi:predicted DNA binding CopG/RHH family protein
MSNRTRDITFHIRLSNHEMDTVKSKALSMGLTTANYIRMLAMTHQVPLASTGASLPSH